MFLVKFSLPNTDTRLITINDTVHKIKVTLVKPPSRYCPRDQSAFCSNEDNHESIENIIVIYLTTNTYPTPIGTDNFVIFPYRKKWMLADKLILYRKDKRLTVSPFVHIFYIVENIGSSSKEKNVTMEEIENVSETSDNERSVSPSILKNLEVLAPETDLDDSDEDAPHDFVLPFMEIPETDFEGTDTEEVCLEKPSKVIISEQRKRQGGKVAEENVKRRRYSVSEYVDTNRHEVDEQDLHEQLRLQDMATPLKNKQQKERNEVNKNKFQNMMSSVKKIWTIN